MWIRFSATFLPQKLSFDKNENVCRVLRCDCHQWVNLTFFLNVALFDVLDSKLSNQLSVLQLQKVWSAHGPNPIKNSNPVENQNMSKINEISTLLWVSIMDFLSVVPEGGKGWIKHGAPETLSVFAPVDYMNAMRHCVGYHNGVLHVNFLNLGIMFNLVTSIHWDNEDWVHNGM